MKLSAKILREMKIIYAATLLSENPSEIHRFIETYPVYQKDGDGKSCYSSLAILNQLCITARVPFSIYLNLINRFKKRGIAKFNCTCLPFFGWRFVNIFFSSESRYGLNLINYFPDFFLFLSSTVSFQCDSRPSYLRANSHFFLRWARRFSVSAVWGLLAILALEPTLLQTPRGQVFVAGFDFALANLLAFANEESMADQNLTIVTAIIAGVFLLVQMAIFMVCLS